MGIAGCRSEDWQCNSGTKGMAKAMEKVRLLEERGANLAAQADKAEALHSSEGDPMTR
jgi:hypothetical protein